MHGYKSYDECDHYIYRNYTNKLNHKRIHTRVLFNNIKEWNPVICRKIMEIETVLLSRIGFTQKVKCPIFSPE